jgi:hypothetical protein
MVPLYRPGPARYYAPWRHDPRPFGGLLHGAYAHLGVSDFWRVQGGLDEVPDRGYARLEYARWSASTGQVIGTLLESGRLTAAGRRLTLALHDRLGGWTQETGRDPAELARLAAVDHRLGWRLRNVQPDRTAIDSLTVSWRAGLAPEERVVAARVADGSGASGAGADERLDLLFMRARDPAQLAHAISRLGADQADLDLVAGNVTAAVTQYRTRIEAEPRGLTAWAGLALGLRAGGQCPAALRDGPEVVYAVYNRLAETGGDAPDPVRLANWLEPVVAPDPVLTGPAIPSPAR